MLQSYNPKSAETDLVWAISTSLATTTEITIVFFSCAYLDVSVQRVSKYLVIQTFPNGETRIVEDYTHVSGQTR